MLCYKDMTFCPYWKECKEGSTCHRALTDEVKQGAERWWPGEAPISVFTHPPKCFNVIEMG